MEEDYEVLSGSNEDDEQICPLCMELLDETDRNLFPCSCGYQVCLWCLHYIRNTMGNKCPACRQDYEESNFKYKTKPTTTNRTLQSKKKRDSRESMSKDGIAPEVTKELLSKDLTREDLRDPKDSKEDQTESLKDVRVIQRNLVYVVGIPLKLAKKDILKKYEYFGQYGKIQHIVVNKSNTYNSHWGGPSYTAYITYSKKSEASCAIQGINGQQIDNKYLRASYGTTKYCSYFLKGLKCFNSDCFYLHQFGDERDRFVKDTSKLMYNNANAANKEASNLNKDSGNMSNLNKDHSPAAKDPREGYKEGGDSTWVSVVSGSKTSNLPGSLGPGMSSTTTTGPTSTVSTNLTTNLATIAANLSSIAANLTASASNHNAHVPETSLFSMPISQCLERYNSSSRLVQLRNINVDRLNSLDTVKKLFRWSHFTQTSPKSNSNKDGKEKDAGPTTKEAPPKDATSDKSSDPKDEPDKSPEHKLSAFVPDEVSVNEIMSRIRRHTMLIDNLSKQYSNTNQNVSTSNNANLNGGNLGNFAKEQSDLGFSSERPTFTNIESYAINVLHNHTPNAYTNNFPNFNPTRDPRDKERDSERADDPERKLELEVFKILQVQLQRNEQLVNHLKLIEDQ